MTSTRLSLTLLLCVLIVGMKLLGCASSASPNTPTSWSREPSPVHLTQTAEEAAVQTIEAALAAEQTLPAAGGTPSTDVAATAEALARLYLTQTAEAMPVVADTATATLRPAPSTPTSKPTATATSRRPTSTPTATPRPPTTVPTSTPTPAPAADAIVRTQALNVRAGPGTNYNVIGGVNAGDELDVTGKNQNSTWLQIHTDEIEKGWVFTELVDVYVNLGGVPVAEAPPVPTSPPPPPPSDFPRLVLGNYFVWYDADKWDDCNLSAGDKPLQTYSSDDPATLARHVRMALDAGLDGFTVHWFAPGERTDRNFGTLLTQSQDTGFRSTVVVSRHIWHGSPAPTQQNVAEAVRYVIDKYGSHPNFLRLQGKPVIFFTDMYRVPVVGGQSPQDAWAAIRAQVDPNNNTWWIAEGLDASYLSVFDGLYVYKITHADYPNDYAKASRWASQVRQWEQRTGKPKLWIATLSPGWDDLRAGCKPDVRVPSTPHKRDREDGAFYQATFDAALKSNPDWLWIHSFNEWVEGTYIESSVQYGDKYMQMTRDFVQQFK